MRRSYSKRAQIFAALLIPVWTLITVIPEGTVAGFHEGEQCVQHWCDVDGTYNWLLWECARKEDTFESTWKVRAAWKDSCPRGDPWYHTDCPMTDDPLTDYGFLDPMACYLFTWLPDSKREILVVKRR
jgi:hypothetical protein